MREGFIEVKSVRTLKDGTEKNSNGIIPRIVQTTLEARSEKETRIVTVLHHEGWVDHFPASDPKLVQTLFDQMRLLSPDPKNPIFINCHAGRSRTFILAVGYYNE